MAATPGPDQIGQTLTAEHRAALDQLLVRVAENADAVGQWLEMVEHLSDSGVLAAVTETIRDLDETFSATVRPELMGMVANLMMILGIVSQLSYEPFFQAAMRTAPALNDAYASFQARREPLGVRETIGIMRDPDVAAVLQVLVTLIRAQRGTTGTGAAA